MRDWLSYGAAALLLFALGCGDDDGSSTCDGFGADGDQDGICDAFDRCLAGVDPLTGASCDEDASVDPCLGFGGDEDGNGVCDALQPCVGDGCGPDLCDGLGGDGDEDGICDAIDPCLADDADAGDDEACPGPPRACDGLGGDVDRDQLCATIDNCDEVANSDQLDVDNDGVGDACDPESCDNRDNDGDGVVDEEVEGDADEDNDGVGDCRDRCPRAPDIDGDDDGLADCIDSCPADPGYDADRDQICRSVDNCPDLENRNQNDRDMDGIGDACEAELCDGITNDADTLVDEGLADEDMDGVCDARDTCPGTPMNDDDSDGICGAVDNCLAIANSDQLDADGDMRGDVCDLDSACGPAAMQNAQGAVLVPTTLQAGDVVVDPVRHVLYVSVKHGDATYPNSVIAVHPATSSVLWSLSVGSEPIRLAVTDDGSRLYVGLNGEGAVSVVDLVTRRACGEIVLGFATNISSSSSLLIAADLDTAPGYSNQVIVAVTTATTGSFDSYSALRRYDENTSLPIVPTSMPNFYGPRYTAFEVATPTTGYALSTSSSSTAANVYEVDIASPRGTAARLIPGIYGGTDMVAIDGLLYTQNGLVIDPTVPRIIVNLFTSGAVTADPDASEVYYMTGSSLRVYSSDTQNLLRTVTVTGTFSPTRLVRWGAHGIAMASSSRLTILDNVAAL